MKQGVASLWAIHSCNELGFPEFTPCPPPFLALVTVSWKKGHPSLALCLPAGGRLPSRMSGWGHHSCWEKEVMCWMLSHLPDVRTFSFYPWDPLTLLHPCVGWGCLAMV